VVSKVKEVYISIGIKRRDVYGLAHPSAAFSEEKTKSDGGRPCGGAIHRAVVRAAAARNAVVVLCRGRKWSRDYAVMIMDVVIMISALEETATARRGPTYNNRRESAKRQEAV
jgi:hypothetical protein